MFLDDKISDIINLCIKYKVESLSVFGSVLNEKFNSSSDIDFLVRFQKNEIKGSFDRYFDLKEELEILLNRSVDLVCEKQIRNPYFKENVATTKQVLYAA